MAGTDRTRQAVAADGAPAVVLVRPQLGENIGAAARAMMNFGLAEMRLVRPRGTWPNKKAFDTASGAHAVLEAAPMFDSTAAAIADLDYVLAATARNRDMIKPVATPAEAAASLRRAAAEGRRAGILFGPERSGLSNDDVVRADALVIVPANPSYSSLNLGQAVLLMGYEWYQAGGRAGRTRAYRKGARPATKGEIQDFFEHLESELDDCGFLSPPEKRPRMVRNIRNIFTRAELTDQEVRTLRGIVGGLAASRRGGD